MKAFDTFSNQSGRVGWGTNNLLEGTSYPLTRLTTSGYILFTSLYRSHWLARKVVDGFAEDMTKNWIEFETDEKPERLKKLRNVVDITATIMRLQDGLRWARLYGGSGCVPIIEGQEDLERPLEIDNVELGAYRGMLVFDRWSGITPGSELNVDTDEPLQYGLPKFYEITTTNSKRMKIHCSRLLRFVGPPLPTWEWMAEQRWGISELEIMFEELKKRDNTSYNIASLVFRANVFALKQKALDQMLSGVGASAQAAQNFWAVISAQSQLMSNQGMFILPETGGLETHQYGFAGIAEVYEQFKEDVCASTGYSYWKLFGRRPGGIGNSDDSDNQQYYDLVAQKQRRELDPALRQLLPIVMMSTWGRVIKDLTWNYNPVRTLSNENKAELAAKKTTAVEQAYNSGIVGRQTALKELKQQGDETGLWTNITDEEIAEADNEVVSPMDELAVSAFAGGGNEGEDNPGPTKPKPSKPKKTKDAAEKFTKAEVDFEHPAKGKYQCRGCKHFLPGQRACAIVAGEITAPDWCKKFDAAPVRDRVHNLLEHRSFSLEAEGKDWAEYSRQDYRYGSNARTPWDKLSAKDRGRWCRVYFDGDEVKYVDIGGKRREGWAGVEAVSSSMGDAATDPNERRMERDYETSLDFQGLKIRVENMRGSTRHHAGGSTCMTAPYGYIARTEGADGDAVDCFVGPVLNAPWVYVIHTVHPGTQDYDEDKVMLGYETAREAQEAFYENYDERGPELFESMERFNVAELKKKLKVLRGHKITSVAA